ncbi:MAG: endonuclease III [Anaerolineae bacterium]|nr:endonuclease III [Anaerolineae bacterium]
MESASRRERTLEVHRRLIALYGEPRWRPHLDPISELVSTILSQNTNDVNRDRAFQRLRERYPTWEEVRDADVEAVKEAIQVSGLANHKGPAIVRALKAITAERGELSLDFLRDAGVQDAKAWLEAINGVGPKTASIVLLFSLGMPAFPVDTHVHRVSRRLGLIGPKVTREGAHQVLEEALPADTYYAAHLNLIRHGRETCTARSPRCEACVLSDVCAYYAQLQAAEA